MGAFFSGESARTSDLRARVAAARGRRPGDHADLSRSMDRAAREAADAFAAGDAGAFVRGAARYGDLLGALGRLADAPIVPAAWDALVLRAGDDGGAFLPSGAGGGDVAVWLGLHPPSAEFVAHALSLGLTALPLALDPDGVRAEPHAHE
jgi:phosphomevalonate kinase